MGKVLLRDVAEVAISNVDKKVLENEIPVKLCNFTDVYYNWSLSSKYSKFLDATATALEIEKFTINNGDVAITKDSETRDDIGISTVFDEITSNLLLGYHCALIRPKKAYLNGAFLNALFHTDFAKKYFSCHASGSGQRYSLSLDSICDFPIELPTLESQLRITNILGSIDKKIEINKKKIARLEAIAQDIYNYWFVQYEFPDETGKPYKSNGGKLVWNEELKRNIPVGWEISKIENVMIKTRNLHRFTTSEYQKVGKFPIIDQSEKFICGFTDDERNIFSFESCIIFGDHTKILKFVNFPFARGAEGTQVICSKVQELPNELLFYQLNSMILPEQGYTRYFKFLKDRFVIIPNKVTAHTYKKIINNILLSKSLLIKSNYKLSCVRDFLLPLLMNGQAIVR